MRFATRPLGKINKNAQKQNTRCIPASQDRAQLGEEERDAASDDEQEEAAAGGRHDYRIIHHQLTDTKQLPTRTHEHECYQVTHGLPKAPL